jgi:hypothetical protein
MECLGIVTLSHLAPTIDLPIPTTTTNYYLYTSAYVPNTSNVTITDETTAAIIDRESDGCICHGYVTAIVPSIMVGITAKELNHTIYNTIVKHLVDNNIIRYSSDHGWVLV